MAESKFDADPPDPGIGLSTMDPEGLSLATVLKAFSAPITEEHGWAIIHQAVLCLDSLAGQGGLLLVRDVEDLMLSKEGQVQACSFTRAGEGRERMTSTAAGVAELGVVVYSALDYSLAEDVSRDLSSGLENVIDMMTSADSTENNSSDPDEGIGSDSEGEKAVVVEVLALCRHHLAVPGEAAGHYRAVCRALVAEALELAQFMSVLRDHSRLDGELLELDRRDWTGLWTSVMGQLRRGIKLRKVDYSRTPQEWEMTPYEMLMDDIRIRNYKLRPPKVDLSQKVKTDAREVILEFIRSRPPLRPASDRQLVTREQQQTPVEQLMSDIRGSKARQSLRRSNRPEQTKNTPVSRRTGGSSSEDVASIKKVIDLDDSFAKNILNFEESPDNSQDDILQSPRSSPDPESPPTMTPVPSMNTVPSLVLEEVEEGDEEYSSTECSPRTDYPLPPPPKSKFSDLIGRLHTLDLNLEEVSHIRCTFTKIELDEMDVVRETRKDYEKGKICFLCANIRFGLFNWAYPCQFCRRLVCSKCCAKIKLPSDKLRDIPVCSLSNQLESGLEESPRSPGSVFNISASPSTFSRSGWDRHSLRTTPSRPQQQLLQVQSSVTPRNRLTRAKSMDKADVALIKSLKLSGEKVGKSHDVCHDCKELLTSLIRAQRHAVKLETMKARFSQKMTRMTGVSDVKKRFEQKTKEVPEVIWPEGEYF